MSASDAPETRAAFWTEYQPGMQSSDAPVGSEAFFAEAEARRYATEPHILELAEFERWAGKDVLEVGCGIGTDGTRFAAAGARYTGVDYSETALELARRQFEQRELSGRFVRTRLPALPFADESFDLVYSYGVLHHLPETREAIAEIRRVLRPGGTAIVMLYHRRSLNYYVSIMVVRRALAALLLLPRGVELAQRVTGERRAVLEGHRELLREHGARYLTDSSLFLSRNTDGPGNPLSKVYAEADLPELFDGFEIVRTDVRFLNLRPYPGGERLARTQLARRLERRVGWHLVVRARKPAASR